MDRPIEGVAKLNPDTGDGEFISVSGERNFTYTPPPLECRVEGLVAKRKGTDGLNCSIVGGVEYLDGVAKTMPTMPVPPVNATVMKVCTPTSVFGVTTTIPSSDCVAACVPAVPCTTNLDALSDSDKINCVGYAQCANLTPLQLLQTSAAYSAAFAKYTAAKAAAEAAAGGAIATSECDRVICCTRLCESEYLTLGTSEAKKAAEYEKALTDIEQATPPAMKAAIDTTSLEAVADASSKAADSAMKAAATAKAAADASSSNTGLQSAAAAAKAAADAAIQTELMLQRATTTKAESDAAQKQTDARKAKRSMINDKLDRGEYAEWDKASDTERSMFLVLGGQQQSESLWKIFQVNCLDGGDYGAQPSLGFKESLCNKTDPFSNKAPPPQWTGAVVAEFIPGWLRNELVIENPDQSREITKTGTRKSTYVSSVQRVSCVSGGGLHNHNPSRGGDRCKQMKADTSRGLGFGVWEIVTSLTDAESFVLGTKTSSQSYSVGERFWVVQQNGGLLMTNLDPKDKSYTQDRQTIAAWDSVVSDSADALLPRVYAAIVARYPGMTMSERLSAIFADLMDFKSGDQEGHISGEGQWTVMEVGHSAEGDSMIELHASVQGRGVEGERGGTRVQGPNSDWLVFGAIKNDARDETPRFVRLQMLNLIVSLMCILIVIYIGSTLAKAQKKAAVKALAESVEQVRRRAVQRKKRGIVLTTASARAGAAQEKGVPMEWGGGGKDGDSGSGIFCGCAGCVKVS